MLKTKCSQQKSFEKKRNRWILLMVGVVSVCFFAGTDVFAVPKEEVSNNTKNLGNMGFEKLIATLSDFKCCKCADCHKRFRSFFEEKWCYDRSLSDAQKSVYVPQCINQPSLSYGQKKRIILQRYKDVIDYINELNSTPLSQLQDKYLKEVKYKYTSAFVFGNHHIFCGDFYHFSPKPEFPCLPTCWWHTRFLAERGCTKAQLILGSNKHGLPGDLDSAWLKKAGLNGEAKACYLMGKLCLEEGTDFVDFQRVVKNVELIKIGIDWLKRGSSMGDVDCMYELGVFAHHVLRDESVALPWFEQAAKMNHGDAINYCAVIYSRGKNANYRRAVEYYEKLISMYENNKKFERDIADIKERIKEMKLKIED